LAGKGKTIRSKYKSSDIEFNTKSKKLKNKRTNAKHVRICSKRKPSKLIFNLDNK